MEKTQEDSILMPQPKFITKKQVGHGFVSNCMTTMNGSNKMFTPRPATGSTSSLLDMKRKTLCATAQGSPLLANKRQSLKVLQPTAGNQDGLVGRSPTNDQDIKKLNFNLVGESNGDQNEKNVSKDQKSSHSSKRGSNKKKLAKSLNKNSSVGIYVDPAKTSSSDGSSSDPEKQTTTNDDIYAMMTQDEAPEGYWKEIAEERRKALADTLEENKNLHNTVNDLTIENERLKKVADQAEYFAGIIEDLLGKKMDETSDNEDVASESNANETNTGCKRKREDDDEEGGSDNKGPRLYSSDEEDAGENVEDEEVDDEENSLFGSYV
ncbi:geminin-like isoform X2 [Anneissia japonica]|uniref:geminin-like isoform X2 n=1 Tax=Anneissia japonica TaxID=1529436 RepID=UPI0014256E49|nr:geminin-like isoform X2 [Anneissia japonica]